MGKNKADGSTAKKWTRRAFLGGGIAAASACLGGTAFLNSTRFGALPDEADLARIRISPNWKDGAFRNIEPFRIISSDKGILQTWTEWLFRKAERTVPEKPLPAVQTDLRKLDPKRPAAVWLGHSSVFLLMAGMRILIDPVFSSHAAPLPVAVKAFPGTELWMPADMPDLDLVFISHDHWDHLDCPTVQAIWPRTKKFVCPLGCGAHLRRFGVPPARIKELDWNGWADGGNISVCLLPSRHFSGRLWTRNQSLWGGFAIEGGDLRVGFTGDGGYGRHFREIGSRFKGGFDLVMPDCGQWNEKWAQVHMFPEEAARACTELNARLVLPVHIGKFCISEHAWDAPFQRFAKASADEPWKPAFPRIGEPVFLDGSPTPKTRWWEAQAPEAEKPA